MHAGNPLVKDHCVGDDGTGHAAGLGNVGHAEQAGYGHGDAGAGRVQFVEDLRGRVDTLLQGGGGLIHGTLRDRYQADEVGQIPDGAIEPPRLGEPGHARGLLSEDAP